MTKRFPGYTTLRVVWVGLFLFIGACNSGNESLESPSASADAETDVITIGLFLPLGAAVGGFGLSAVDGAELAVEQINAAGGIDGHSLELLVQDNGCNTSDGANAVQKLLSEEPKPVALIGGLCSDSTLAALPIAKRHRIPLLVDLASNPSITEQSGIGGNEWAFHWAPNDTMTAQSAIDFLIQLGSIRSIAVIASDDSFGRGGLAALTKAAQAAGISVVSSDAVNLASADFAPIIARAKTHQPDALALWINAGPAVASFYEQYGSAGMAGIPLVGQLDQNQPAIAEYGLIGYNSAAYDFRIDTPENRAFTAAWLAAGHDVSSSYVGWDGYQSVLILAAAIGQAATLDAAGIRDALETLIYTPSIVGGTISFDDHHQAYDNVVVSAFNGAVVESVTILERTADH
jgi:branched-chain amino acid transport system substrate-binding protein